MPRRAITGTVGHSKPLSAAPEGLAALTEQTMSAIQPSRDEYPNVT